MIKFGTEHRRPRQDERGVAAGVIDGELRLFQIDADPGPAAGEHQATYAAAVSVDASFDELFERHFQRHRVREVADLLDRQRRPLPLVEGRRCRWP